MQIRATSDFSLDAETVAHEGDVLEVQDRLGHELISANKAVKDEPEQELQEPANPTEPADTQLTIDEAPQ